MPNLEGLMSFDDDLDSEGGSKLERFAHETLDPSLSWKDVEWLKSITSLPILLKGIVTAEDARKAVEVGAAGVIVSNHGARQLDYAPPTISALEEVVKAVAGAVPVLVDGGSGGAPTCSRRWRWAPRQSWWGGRCSTGWRRAGRPGRGTSSRC